MRKNKELIEIIGEKNFKKLPLIYANLTPFEKEDSIIASFVKSNFHQTEAYCTEPFYKPISKIFIPLQENNE
jgi:hypothetical protein